MSDEKDIALRKKIAEALIRARKIVAEHKAEYLGVYTASGGGGTTQSTSTTMVPQDVLNEYNQVTAQANQVAATPLQQYSGQIVAGQTAPETSAYNTINNMQGITAPYTQAASGLLGQASQNIDPQTVTASQIQGYESPYTQNVLNTTMAAENNQDAQQQAQLQGNAISSGAWGGDRSAVAQGILGGQQAIANNATNAGILNQGYAQALQEANTQQQAGLGAQEASQYLQNSAGLGMSQLGTTAQNNVLTGANAQYGIGQAQQQQTQAELNVPYEQFLQQQAYPFQTTGWLGNIAEGIGSNTGSSTTGSTTQPSQGLFSDRRLKKNIHNAGILAGSKGDYPLHTFEYKGDNTRHVGVIAQEVEKKNPDAVGIRSGYKTVDYSKLARGGIVQHRDDGGSITPLAQGIAQNVSPFQKNVNSSYSQMNVQQLQQLAQRMPPGTPQGQAIQAALRQKQFMPNVAKGGGILPHYDGGGGAAFDGDYNPEDYAMAPGNAMGIQDAARDGIESIPNDNGYGQMLANSSLPAQNITTGTEGQEMPPPTAPISATDHPINSKYETEMPQTHEANPWLSVAAGVLGTLAGRSRNPLVDIGQGGLIGLNNYAQQVKTADEQNYQEGNFHQNAQKLMDEAENTRNQFGEEKLRDANTAQYQKGELGLRAQELQKPIFDKYGNPWQLNPKTKTYERVDLSPTGAGGTGSSPTNNNPRDAAVDILQQEGVPILPVAPNDPGALKAQQAYESAGQTAQQMLDTLNHQKALVGTYTSGPRGAANDSWIPSAAGLKYGAEEKWASNSPDLAARQEAEKDANTLAMQQTSLLKNARPGLRMIQFSGTTVPNPNMSDKAQSDLIGEWTDKLNQQIQRGQIASLYSGLHPKNIDAIMNNYETNNPTTLGDGSRNSNWMPYKQWIASGRPDTAQMPQKNAQSGATSSGVIKYDSSGNRIQ